HSGSLRHRIERSAAKGPFEPVGSTDSELVFCDLLALFAENAWRSIGDADPNALRAFFERMSAHGNITSVFTDGRDLVAYADAHGESTLYLGLLRPPYEKLVVADYDLELDLGRRGVKSRKGVLVASNPLEGSGVAWSPMIPGHLV